MRPSAIATPFLALALLASLPRAVPACSCTFLPDFATAYAQSEAVFLGEVLGVESAAPDYLEAVWVTLRVEAQWKGAPSATIPVLTGNSDANCGVGFVPGGRYLVYALAGNTLYGALPPGGVWTHLCWRTNQYWPEDPDLVALGPTPVASGSWGSLKIRYR